LEEKLMPFGEGSPEAQTGSSCRNAKPEPNIVAGRDLDKADCEADFAVAASLHQARLPSISRTAGWRRSDASRLYTPRFIG
jgi:hypothetical protein